MSKRAFLLVAVIVGAVAYLVSLNLDQSMVYYYTVEEFHSRQASLSTRGIRVTGHASAIAIEGQECRFNLVGETETLPVFYRGLRPDTFKAGAEVVAEGRWNGEREYFDATSILAKCPSKYEAEDPQKTESAGATTAYGK